MDFLKTLWCMWHRFFEILYTVIFCGIMAGIVGFLSARGGFLPLVFAWAEIITVMLVCGVFAAYGSNAGKKARRFCMFFAAGFFVLFLLIVNFMGVDRQEVYPFFIGGHASFY